MLIQLVFHISSQHFNGKLYIQLSSRSLWLLLVNMNPDFESHNRRKYRIPPGKPTPNFLLDGQPFKHRAESHRITVGTRPFNWGMVFRKAAEKVYMAPSTLYDQCTYQMKSKNEHSWHIDLTYEEEMKVVELLWQYPEPGTLLSQKYFADVVSKIVEKMPVKRWINLPFREGTRGVASGWASENRPNDLIEFRTVPQQEAARYTATNGTIRSKHFCKIETLINFHKIDPKRIINADETNVSA